MRPPQRGLRIFALAVGTLLAAPGVTRAQAPRVSPAAATPLARQSGAGDLRVPRLDLFELSRYAGWGGTIGASLGLAYGLAFERGGWWQLEVVGDTVFGFSIGLAVGTAVYVAKLALGRGYRSD
jgi:hypothetical protein